MITRLVTAQKVFADSIKDTTSQTLISTLNKEREIAYPIPLTRELYNRSRLKNNLYDLLNQGKEAPITKPNLRLAVLDRVQKILAKQESRDIKALEKRAEKQKMSVDEIKAEMLVDRMKWRSRDGKMPGISTYSAVAIVKNKEGDVARTLVGPITKQVTEKVNPYANA